MSRRTLVYILVAGVAVLLVGGGTGAVLCKYSSLDCGLTSEAAPAPLEEIVKPDRTDVVLPQGFRQNIVAKGLTFPADFDFLPDGRILVAQRDGLFRLVESGRLQARPVLDLRGTVDLAAFRGLVTVDIDPDFQENGFFYTVYSPKTGAATEPTTVRVSRFTMRGDVADRRSERVLLGTEGEEPCLDLPAGADCLPGYVDHLGADILFLNDGTMLVATGDGGGRDAVEDTAFGAQDLDYLGGKILRVTRTGAGVPDNPFWNGSTEGNRSKVWASGLRNPFRLAAGPGGAVYVGDVGWRTREEISAVERGANLGWPCFEGTVRTMEYQDTDFCRALYERPPASLQKPLLDFPHADAVSLTLGDFSAGLSFPERFRRVLFFGDWGKSWLRYAAVKPDGSLGPAQPFARGAAGPVAIKVGPDGALYYSALNAGELRRIRPA